MNDKEMLKALEELMKALDKYDSFREQYTGFYDLWKPQDKQEEVR